MDFHVRWMGSGRKAAAEIPEKVSPLGIRIQMVRNFTQKGWGCMCGAGWEQTKREGTGLVPMESPTVRAGATVAFNIQVTLLLGWLLSNPGQQHNQNWISSKSTHILQRPSHSEWIWDVAFLTTQLVNLVLYGYLLSVSFVSKPEDIARTGLKNYKQAFFFFLLEKMLEAWFEANLSQWQDVIGLCFQAWRQPLLKPSLCL